MQKKPELTEQTKRNLEEAFLDIYNEKDIAKISVKEITERAGYNRSTFYSYFNNVNDVLNDIVDSLFSQAKEIGELHIGDNSFTKDGRFEDSISLSPDESFIRFYEENSKVLTIMFHKVRSPIFTQNLREWIQPQCEQLMESLPEKERVKMSYVLEYHISGLFAILAKWHKEDKNLTLTEVWNLIALVNNQGTLPVLHRVFEKYLKKNE